MNNISHKAYELIYTMAVRLQVTALSMRTVSPEHLAAVSVGPDCSDRRHAGYINC